MFDQIFGQGFDQGLLEDKNHKYSVQYYPLNPLNPLNLLIPLPPKPFNP